MPSPTTDLIDDRPKRRRLTRHRVLRRALALASQQVALPFRRRGGKRPGAGRKPGPGRPRVRHAKRPRLARGNPAHITMRVKGKMPSLRSQSIFATFRRSLRQSSKDGLRIVHFSVQRDHIHMIVEATDSKRLGRGMGGLASGFARKLNAMLGRRGRVFAGRYHRRDLTSPREVRSALVYVLQNGIKHGVARTLDTFSSAAFFEGWATSAEHALACLRAALARDEPAPVVAPSAWLLRIAWKRHGLIAPYEAPGRKTHVF